MLVNKLIELKKEYAIAEAHFRVKGGSDDLFGDKPKAVKKEIDQCSQELDDVIFSLYHLEEKQKTAIKQWYDELFPLDDE
jgi:hypothetical protein